MRKVLLSLLLLVSSTLIVNAQNGRPKIGKRHPGLVSFKVKPGQNETNVKLRELYQMRQNDELQFVRSKLGKMGYRHFIFQQYYNGIPVEGGQCKVHVKEGKIWSISGSIMDIFEDLSTSPNVGEWSAYRQALRSVAAEEYMWQMDGSGRPRGELVVVADPNGKIVPRLAYKFDIYATKPLYRANVYIDAHNRDLIWENHILHNADAICTGTSLYNGNVGFTGDFTGSQYRLRQTSDGNGIRTFSLNNGTNYNAASDVVSPSDNFTSDPTAVQAHWGAEQTHKYFLQEHGRNSYDGNGAIINSYVHYSSNYVNAFWDGQRMTYGDGDGVNYGPLVSLDIVGHEITHGLTSFSANLIYQNESGALNESFSDIFGEAIERFGTGTNDWQMGTDMGIGGSGAIRSMDNPNAFNDPDTYGGSFWYTGSGDNGGVHINSGVQNKWFYILTEGESGTNDLGNSYNVTGIGMDKSAAIAFRNLTVYLGPSSNFSDARAGAIQSAIDLFGAGSAEEIATTNAWYAVGVGGEYGTISYCTSRGNDASYEWISNVTIGSFSNASGSAGYTDFTNQTVSVDEGQSYSVSLTPAFSGTIYNEYWKIWIDYNDDGDFSDSGELAFDGGGLTNTTETGTISIPTGLGGTTTRMRVSMKWNAAQTECETFNYGEVEDYTIDIGGGSAPTCDTPTGLSTTSVGINTASLDWSDVSGAGGYTVRWRINGTSTWTSGTVAGSSGTLNGLAEGTTYEVQVQANCTGANSTFTSSITFTTDVTAPTCSTPTGLVVTAVGTTTASIDWADISGATAYNVRWRVLGTTTWQTGTVGGSGGNFSNLAEGTTYEVQVQADCGGTTSNFTSSANFTTDSSNPGGCTTVDNNDFESGWGIWNDGGSDARRSAGDAAYSNGTYSIRLRDNTSTSTMTTDNMDLSNYDYITVSFSYLPRSMDNSNEDFWLQISNNGGGSYSTEHTWARNIDFNNNTRYNESVTIAGPFAANSRLRFRCDASGNSDWVYIDDVVIEGCTNASNSTNAIILDQPIAEIDRTISTPISIEKNGTQSIQGIASMTLFPNPVKDVLNISYEVPSMAPLQLIVTDINGRTVLQQTLAAGLTKDNIQINTAVLSNGFYIVHIVGTDQRLSQKFVVQE
ncbi:MAG: M4 family metallopeptidase [Bacteroidota bacterium]